MLIKKIERVQQEFPGEVKSLENIQDVLLQLQNQGYNVDLDESLANAYKMILLDLLTLHIDRNSGGFLKANYLKIATEFSAYQSRIQACVRFAKSNPQMKETLFSTLSNIDINLAIEQLKAENVVLNDYYKFIQVQF